MIVELALAILVQLVPQVPEVPRAPQVPQVQQARLSPEVVTEVLVHGNQIVNDAEVKSLAGIAVGSPFNDALLAEIAKRLKESGKFESIDVVKRFASIEDASRIIIVIIVSEGPVRIVMPGDSTSPAQAKKRSFIRNLMFVPMFEGSDGYGLTFGARIAYPKPLGAGSRLSFPMTLGGVKRIGVELDKAFSKGPISRVEVGTGVQQRRNPAYDTVDTRYRFWARALRIMGPVRAGGTGSWQTVSFGGQDDSFSSAGLDVTLDTRQNPAMPRNAVLATAAADALFFGSGPTITRTRLEATGFVGVVGQHVLVVHALREDANQPLPPYLRSILGGWWTLRGYETGFMTGDTLLSGSLEYRVPIGSPRRFGKLGVSAFMDWGTAYDHGQSLSAQPIYRGAGGTVWFAVLSARLAMAVGRGLDAGGGTRVHFSGTIGF